MVLHQKIKADWSDNPCIVAASGPSLTSDVVRACRFARWLDGWNILAVNDAYKVMPFADALYAADGAWWDIHKDAFKNERWSCYELNKNGTEVDGNEKKERALKYGLNLIRGKSGNEFSLDRSIVHYGSNSGFQAVNLAILRGCKRIVLVGFDMRHVDGKAHFFGDHPEGLHNASDRTYSGFASNFEVAAKSLPADISIINATPGSALTCFPMMSLEKALDRKEFDRNRLLNRDRAVSHA